MTKKKSTRKRPTVVRFKHATLDDLLGAHGSDRREAICRKLTASFARRGMNVKLDKLATGEQGPSVATLYLLSEELGVPMKRFILDDIVAIEREARLNPEPTAPQEGEE